MISDTFRKLVGYAGKILFVSGIVLPVFLLFLGFWPSLLYLLFVLGGTALIFAAESRWPQWCFPKVNLEKLTRLLQKFDYFSTYQTLVKYTWISVIVLFVLVGAVYALGNNGFKVRDTRREMKEIAEALQHNKIKTGVWPSSLTEITTGKPLRKGWQQDAWNNTYQYTVASDGKNFTLTSAGEDGKLNTNDDLK